VSQVGALDRNVIGAGLVQRCRTRRARIHSTCDERDRRPRGSESTEALQITSREPVVGEFGLGARFGRPAAVRHLCPLVPRRR
jgi:hypothetical protein